MNRLEPILGIAVGGHVINVHLLLLCQEPSIQTPVQKEEMVSSVLLLSWDSTGGSCHRDETRTLVTQPLQQMRKTPPQLLF